MHRLAPLIGLLLTLTTGCGGNEGSSASNPGTAATGGQAASSSDGSGNAATGGASSSTGGGQGSDGSGAASSSGGSAGAGAGDPSSTTNGATLASCTTWRLDRADESSATAEVADSALLLQRPGTEFERGSNIFNGASVALSQEGLTGDFDIVVTWEGFQPGDATPFIGPHAQAGVWWDDPEGTSIYQANGSVGAGSAGALVSHGDQFTLNYLERTPSAEELVDASGSFRIQRVSAWITVTTTVNEDTVVAESTEVFGEEPLTFFMEIGTTGSAGVEDSSIRITSVSVEGGGGLVQADDFTCEP